MLTDDKVDIAVSEVKWVLELNKLIRSVIRPQRYMRRKAIGEANYFTFVSR